MAATVESLTVRLDSNVAQVATTDTRALTAEVTTMEVLEQRATRLGKTIDQVARATDGNALAAGRAAAINRTYTQSVEAVNAALAKGDTNATAAAESIRRLGIVRDRDLARAQEQAAALEARFTQQTATTQKLTTATGSASMAVRQLGIQSIDVFQQLASGAPIMTTFIQQGGQITQVAAQGGVSFGQLARGVGSFIAQHAGIIAGTAAVAALGVAVYSVASRSSELEAQQRALGVAIAGVGRSAELSGSQLQGYVTELKRQGVAAGDAVAGIAALARNSGVSGAMIGRIAGLAPDAAAALGVGVPETMSRLAEAAKGTADAIEKLDDAFNLLTPAQAASVRQMADHGDKAKALQTVFDALGERVKGLHEQSLSPMGAALERIGNAWDGWMDRVAKSDIVIKAVATLARAINSISSAIEGPSVGQQQQDAAARLLQLQFDQANAGNPTSPSQRAMAQSRAAEIARLSGMVGYSDTGIPDFGGPAVTVTPPIPPLASDQFRSLARQAANDAAGTPEGQISRLTAKLGQYREALAMVGARNAENAALFDDLTGGIKATTDAIEAARKKGEEHRTGLQKYADTLQVQIQTQQELADAYRQGPEAVVRLTSAQKAAEKAISESLVPGTAKYRAEVEKTTESLVRLAEATGQTAIAKQVSELDRATDAQLAIMAAYDGTAESITKATNQQKAYTDALKAQLIPGTREFTDAVSTISDAYNRSSQAASAFEQAQRSVQSLMDALVNTVDRLAQGLVDAFLSGSSAAVNFGNIAKAALASLASEGVKQAVINPLLNSVLGGNRTTLGAAFGALGNGTSDSPSGSLNIMNAAGNLSTGVGITDMLGLTNIKSMFSGLGETLGITGQGGLLSGLNSIMATQLWSTGLGAVPLEGAYSAAQVAASGATTSLGGLLGGAGLGFGAGTLLNSLLGGKSTGGTIGSGVGSLAGAALGSIIPGVGTILGGLLGGVLGGAGGGLIGPNAPNAYSSTGVSLSGGQLSLGATVSQLVDTTQEVANATAQMAQINSFLAQQGISISSLGSLGQIGQNTPGKAADPTKFSDLASAFSQLRFTSDDALKAAQIADKSFGSITELAQALQDVATKSAQTTDLLDNVIPTLTKANDNVGTVAQQMAALAQPYNQAFASIQAALAQAQTPETTARLTQGATDIVAALEGAQNRAMDGIRKQIDASDQALAVRYAQASANASGDKGQMRDAALMAFDFQAQQARTAYADQLTGLFGDAYAQTADYAGRLAALDRTTAQERLAVAKQYAEDVVAVDQTAAARQQAAQSALGVITSLSDYSRSLTYGAESPLSPMSQYAMAQRDFQAVAGAARAGDFNSISKLSGYADTFLRASRTVNGSGIAYANDFAAVQDTIKGVASQSVESIIAAAMAANVAASEAIAQKQDTTNDLLTRVLAELQQANLRPAA